MHSFASSTRCSSLLLALVCAASCSEDCGNGNPDAGPDAGDALAFHDPISRPEEPTLDLNQFLNPESCAECHENHYNEWTQSLHSYAMTDPVFRGLVRARQEEFNGEQDQFCLQCHTTTGTRGGEIVDNFRFEDLNPRALEGVSCENCHKMQNVVRPCNAGHTLNPLSPMRGPIEDPVDNPFHASEFSPLYEDPLLCGSCHDVKELNGLPLERPYEEFLNSPAFGTEDTCQKCHMPTYTGVAAEGAPERTLHRHFFVGVDAPLAPGVVSEEQELAIKARASELLQSGADLELVVPSDVEPGGQIDVLVTAFNRISAHNLPTGSTFIRQLWIEVVATDANGVELYATGLLDDNGDLKDVFSELEPYGDNDLIRFGSALTDARGDPQILPWRATEHTSTTIEPLRERTFTLFVPTREDTAFPVTVDARLRFRPYGNYLLRFLELDELIARNEIVDIDLESGDVFARGAPPVVDAGPDAGPEAGPDAGLDAGPDAGDAGE